MPKLCPLPSTHAPLAPCIFHPLAFTPGLDQCAAGGRPCSAFGVCQVSSGGKNATCICRPDTCRPTGTVQAATACACDDANWMDAALQFQFQQVRGIAVDPLSGDVIVPDTYNGRILRYTAAGRLASVLWSAPQPLGSMELRSAAFSPDGAVFYLWDKGNRKIMKFARSGGAPVLSFDLPAGANAVTDIDLAVEPTAGDVFAADWSNKRVVRLRPDNGGLITAYTYSNNIQAVAVAPDGSKFATLELGTSPRIQVRLGGGQSHGCGVAAEGPFHACVCASDAGAALGSCNGMCACNKLTQPIDHLPIGLVAACPRALAAGMCM